MGRALGWLPGNLDTNGESRSDWNPSTSLPWRLLRQVIEAQAGRVLQRQGDDIGGNPLGESQLRRPAHLFHQRLSLLQPMVWLLLWAQSFGW